MAAIVFGSRVAKSPYFDATIAAGATAFTIYNHTYMPLSYGDPDAEYRALTERVSLWDVAAERQVEIVGPDAAALTQRLSARNLERLAVGRARYAPMCDHRGRLINDPVVLRLDDDRYWLSIADNDVLLFASAVCGEGGYRAQVFEPDVSPLAIQGPRSADVVAELFGEWTRELRFFGHAPASLDGIPLVVCRSGWSHQGGFELFLTDRSRGTELWNRVWEAGEPHGIAPGAPNPQERVESDLLSFGADHPRDADPFEVGLGHLVDLDAGHEFVGRDALVAARERGLRRTRIGLHIDGPPMGAVEHPLPLRRDGDLVGTLRIGVFSPRFDRMVGIGFVDIDVAEPGTVLAVDDPTGERTATTVALPFA